MFKDKTIVLGVTGAIPVYKSCELVRLLKKEGADVWVIMTDSAQKFVSPLTFRTLSGNPVITDLFDEKIKNIPVPHITLREKADLVLVSPATANIIGKSANGIADNALSTLLLSVKCPVYFAPAMNPVMWNNQIVQENISKIKKAGINIIDPEEGKVICGDEGVGRLAELSHIIESISTNTQTNNDLEGANILITAGATREAIDPIRFISNSSSGKMGYSLAEAAKNRGAHVTLISGPTNLVSPKKIALVKVNSAEEMLRAVNIHSKEANVIIMTAAIADYRPTTPYMQKLQKRNEKINLELTRTTDILNELGKRKNGTYLVGFAAESNNLIENAKEKLKTKNLDLIVANDLSAFGKDSSEVSLIDASGNIESLKRQKKSQIATAIIDKIVFAKN